MKIHDGSTYEGGYAAYLNKESICLMRRQNTLALSTSEDNDSV